MRNVKTIDAKKVSREKWLVGGPAINRMEANGWTKTTVMPGDVITGIGYQFADGQKISFNARSASSSGSDSGAIEAPTGLAAKVLDDADVTANGDRGVLVGLTHSGGLGVCAGGRDTV